MNDDKNNNNKSKDPLYPTRIQNEEETFEENENGESIELSLNSTEIPHTPLSLSVLRSGNDVTMMEGNNDNDDSDVNVSTSRSDENNNKEQAIRTATVDPTDEEGTSLSLKELMYASNSYHAIAKPVSITMILAALAVLHINTDETRSAAQTQMSNTYTVFTISNDQGTATNLANSLGNTFIIVAVICFMTFAIVLLYKFRCMKLLIGYMVLSSTVLYFLLGGLMFQVAINKYSLYIDYLSYIFTLYNFSIVGTIAVFYQEGGVPTFVTHFYLIATSVILAWQLSNFDEWTAWTLLVMLALYDLCAVLTPCGPLKALVNLMSREDAPEMPGLLYEAELTRNNTNTASSSLPSHSTQQQQQQQQQQQRHQNQSAPSYPPDHQQHIESRKQQQQQCDANQNYETNDNHATIQQISNTAPSPYHASQPQSPQPQTNTNNNTSYPKKSFSSSPTNANHDQNENQKHNDTQRTAMLPLVIAKIYKLTILSPPDLVLDANNNHDNLNTNNAATTSNDDYRTNNVTQVSTTTASSSSSPNTILAHQYTPQQLLSNVQVSFPTRGGWIEVVRYQSQQSTTSNDDDENDDGINNSFKTKWKRLKNRSRSTEGSDVVGTNNATRYIVKNRRGEVKRVLLLDDMGKVYEEIEEKNHSNSNHEEKNDEEEGRQESEENEKKERNSIRLGLGDFIFYSVLVSKAAQNSFTTFASCMLVVLAGLGSTLVLLSVYQQALPALPISIFMGVVFYLLTKVLMEPWIKEIWSMPYYV